MNDQGSESESTPPPNNDISCQRCKLKKIRCNRSKPICGKCESLGVECTYIARRTGPRRNRRLEGMLQEIFQRLDRLEGLIVAGPAQQPLRVGNQLDTPMPTPSLQVNQHAAFNPVLDLVIETSKAAREQLTSGSYQSTHEEIQTLLATLPQTVCDVQEQLSVKRKSWQMTSWNIPIEKAKKWVNYWFDSIGMESRFLHPRRDFITSIPDLLENPHIRIDFATQITYYNLLYSGMVFHEDQDVEQGSYGRQIYRRILSLIPEWEREAGATTMDFLASFFTVSMTLAFSEPDLGYKMLSYSCKTGQGLGLFQIDNPDEPQSNANGLLPEIEDNPKEKDRMRMAFWFLLHYDCIFRLRFKRPALIQQGAWAVKIPSVVDDIVNNIGFDPLHFIVCTKITLVIMKFFELVEHEIPPDIGPRVCSLVEEINSIAVTWRLEKNIMTATDIVGRYLYVDQLFSSYVNIILICSYRPELLHIPELNECLMKAARGSLGLLIQMTKSGFKSSWQTSVRSSWLLVSYLAIYRTILQTPDLAKSVSDLDSMVWLESTLDTWSEQHEEIVALQVAIKGLNRIVHLSVEPMKSSASLKSPSDSLFGTTRVSFLVAVSALEFN
ncbi:hypothetical protein BKA61DRAFT_666723 [Leptodontidium sp. MPI-SDFR-AT-0119]|nr:hypothetical protein BKA61DRAFT_666723 [Leptodontidium sp. MPI-SDFR-AT-0119]